MSKEYLEAGKIVGTHGVRGEMRLKPWSDDASFLKGFQTVYTDAAGKQALNLLGARAHGNVTLVRIEGIESIEQAEKMRGKTLYIQKKDAHLPAGSYFIDDIIGLTVLDEQSGETLGTVTDVEQYPANDVWTVQNGEKQYLIPHIPPVVKKVDIAGGKVYIFKMKGLFEDED